MFIRASNTTYSITIDHEIDDTFSEAARHNGNTWGTIGPGKVFRVTAGDKVDLRVFTKYSKSTGNSSDVITNFIAAVTSALGEVNGGETQTLYQAFGSNLLGLSLDIASSVTQVLKAYINYLIFNDNDVFQQFGYQEMT